ncbi:MAG: hypothetical protein Kow00107_03880 [Planctomycetota bacterium]
MTIQDQPFNLNWKLLGTWFACIGVLYFSLLVYDNYRLIQAQRQEIASLRQSVSQLQSQQSELDFIRSALAAREPYFYINSLREDWGYRKKGEKYLSELPPRHYITKGIPVFTVKNKRREGVDGLGKTTFFLLMGLGVSALTFLLLASVGIRKRKEKDKVAEMSKLFFSDSLPKSDEQPFND